MIESLRAFGYDLPTAIADLIDNSITANCKNIHVKFDWAGENSTISIADDGSGIDSKTLSNAMRLGSKSPMEDRTQRDLGRFGLGLKTASFSQCKRLTVATKHDNDEIIIRCWDLDEIVKTSQWRLLKLSSDNTYLDLTYLKNRPSGTIIFWEKMDQIVKQTKIDDIKSRNYFHEQIEYVAQHLSMIFHRYLLNKDKLKIFLNTTELEPWNPFLDDFISTQKRPSITLSYKRSKIIIKPYILPHRSLLTDRIYKNAEGPKGWNDQQGFYVYRNERLIIAGGWLGLGLSKEEPYKLARVRVDIPNSLDIDWNIDVKKSVARPPVVLKNAFKTIANDVRDRSAKVYYARAKTIERKNDHGFDFVWKESINNKTLSYVINREHPLVKEVTDNHENPARVKALLKLIEATIPVDLILLRNIQNPDKKYIPFQNDSEEILLESMSYIYDSLLKRGMSSKDAKDQLAHMEPFNYYPDLYNKFFKLDNVE